MPRPTIDTPAQLLTIRDVAAFCRVSEKTVRRWIDARDLAAAKLGAQWRIRPHDLDLFVRDHLNW